ncbi:hypothetical protein ACYULU_11905 [Breznakiellaceae bacterium SP9]
MKETLLPISMLSNAYTHLLRWSILHKVVRLLMENPVRSPATVRSSLNNLRYTVV